MRKWYVPLTVIGISGVGMFFLTERGRKAARWAFENMNRAPDALLQWNETAQRELDRVQSALNRVAESLGTIHAPGTRQM
jgi:hypothetical protein